MKDVTVRIGINFLFGRDKPKDKEEKVKKVKKKKVDLDIGPFPPGYGLGHLDSLKADSLRHHGIEPDSSHFDYEKPNDLGMIDRPRSRTIMFSPDVYAWKESFYARRERAFTSVYRKEFD